MTLDVFFTPAELVGHAGDGAFVVVDVIRATSTVVTALQNGARSVFPVHTGDDAARLAQSLGREHVLLCGERKGLPIEGFDLGNSPQEFTEERVAGKALVMTTTNGTAALLSVAELPRPKVDGTGQEAGGRRVLLGAFLNLDAVAEAVAGEERVTVVCAGREGRFALEDAVFAGALAQRLEALGAECELNDAARAAEALSKRHMRRLASLFRKVAAGRALLEIGLGDDLDFVAHLDWYDAVPVYDDRTITLLGS